MRVTLAAGLVVAALAAGIGAPGAALAQGPANPLLPGIPQSNAPIPTSSTPTIIAPTTTPTSSSNSGLSGTNAIVIALGAIVILAGISLFIWRDARRRAPVRHRTAEAMASGGRSGSKRPIKPRKLSAAERRRRKRGRAR